MGEQGTRLGDCLPLATRKVFPPDVFAPSLVLTLGLTPIQNGALAELGTDIRACRIVVSWRNRATEF